MWELIEQTGDLSGDVWSVTERMKLGDSYLVRAVWQHRIGGERLQGSAVAFTAGFELPEKAKEEPHGGHG